jgi:hypothetical protein
MLCSSLRHKSRVPAADVSRLGLIDAQLLLLMYLKAADSENASSGARDRGPRRPTRQYFEEPYRAQRSRHAWIRRRSRTGGAPSLPKITERDGQWNQQDDH